MGAVALAAHKAASNAAEGSKISTCPATCCVQRWPLSTPCPPAAAPTASRRTCPILTATSQVTLGRHVVPQHAAAAIHRGRNQALNPSRNPKPLTRPPPAHITHHTSHITHHTSRTLRPADPQEGLIVIKTSKGSLHGLHPAALQGRSSACVVGALHFPEHRMLPSWCPTVACGPALCLHSYSDLT